MRAQSHRKIPARNHGIGSQSSSPAGSAPPWVARLTEDPVAGPSERFMENLRSIFAEAETLAQEALATELLGGRLERLMPV